ncbi:MAG: beta-N-acetylglucosaminidase domain-containing protein [Victivallaceae bacterium]|nr:beta-N-acetylglucosaminidase domain-containing protein [Victivallaceae bacterium]
MNIMRNFVLTGILLLVFMSSRLFAAEKNLIKNSSFEKEGEAIPNWKVAQKSGSEILLSDNAHSGRKSVKITNNRFLTNRKALNVGIYTKEFHAPPYRSKVKVSGWLKADNVKKGPKGYHKLRLVLYALDENKGMLAHKDIAKVDGSFDWTEFSGSMIIPKGTDLLKVGCMLTNATGTVWVDDIKVIVTNLPPSAKDMLSGDFNIATPVIMPKPWKIKRTDKIFIFNKIYFNSQNLDKRIKDATDEYFTASRQVAQSNYLELIFSKTFSTEIRKIAENNFVGISLKDIGDQGYFVLTETKPKNIKVYLVANTDRGLFYALQTLKQAVKKINGGFTLSIIQVVDKPLLALRGAVIGLWLRQHKEMEIIRRSGASKVNFAFVGGTTLNNKLGGNPKFGTNWRKPFTSNELRTLKGVIDECHKNFIDPAITFSPRGTPANCYSSDQDINIIVDKTFAIYQLGGRTFGINFDDMSNSGSEGLGNERDRVKFKNNVGDAHRYFARQIYERLKRKIGKNDFKFLFLPMAYGRFKSMSQKDKAYLKNISSLPREIEFISCVNGDDVLKGGYSEYIQRKPIIWDNFFSGWGRLGGAPVFASSFEGDTLLNSKSINGYIFPPLMKQHEDGALISWMTITDYMWAPERYNYQESFKRAVLKAVGGQKNIPELADYISKSGKLSELAMPLKDKKMRLKYIMNNIKFLKKSKVKLKKILSTNLYKSEMRTIDKNLKNLELIKRDLSKKPFPVPVNRLNSKLKIDGRLDEKAWMNCQPLGDFTNIKTLKPAKYQTVAKMLYDDKYLYIGIISSEGQNASGIVAKHSKRDSQVFKDDSIELFFDPEQNMENYYHIAVNTLGTVYDAIVKNNQQKKSWNGTYNVKTKVGRNSWTLEMAIPINELGIKSIKAGQRWNFNICREKHSMPKEFSSYALLLLKGFHNPTRFWTMEFINNNK